MEISAYLSIRVNEYLLKTGLDFELLKINSCRLLIQARNKARHSVVIHIQREMGKPEAKDPAITLKTKLNAIEKMSKIGSCFNLKVYKTFKPM